MFSVCLFCLHIKNRFPTFNLRLPICCVSSSEEKSIFFSTRSISSLLGILFSSVAAWRAEVEWRRRYFCTRWRFTRDPAKMMFHGLYPLIRNWSKRCLPRFTRCVYFPPAQDAFGVCASRSEDYGSSLPSDSDVRGDGPPNLVDCFQYTRGAYSRFLSEDRGFR